MRASHFGKNRCFCFILGKVTHQTCTTKFYLHTRYAVNTIGFAVLLIFNYI